ncbi:MAG: SPFH domain-containing protein [Pseudomonadota bacterium]
MDISFFHIGVIGLVGAFLYSSVIITQQKTLKHLVLLGKYWRTAAPGLSFKIPLLTWVDKTSDTNIKQLEVPLRLKTKDQVTFSISLKVFYKVADDVKEAYKSAYNLDSFEDQMLSVATDSAIPVANSVELENVFNSKEEILERAADALTAYFSDYGIVIDKVLSDEPQLPLEVENSANEVIAAQRLNDAARYKAEAIKTEKVGEATADGESVKIRMEEVGKARKEYAEITSEAILILQAAGVEPNLALNFLTRVGDQDALVTASRNSDTAILSLAPSNSGSNDIIPMVTALMAGNTTSGNPSPMENV